jgi:heptosyltransferase II
MEKILIIKTHAIGDVLMATPAFRALRLAYPDAEITILIGKWSSPIIKNNPYITKCIEFHDDILHKKRLIDIIKLLIKIRSLKFNSTVILHPSPFIHFFTALAGIKNRFGLSRGGKNFFLTASIEENGAFDYYYPMNFVKLVNLITPKSNKNHDLKLDVFLNENDRRAANEILKHNGITNYNKLILIAPGGSANPKEKISVRLWPCEYYIKLIRCILREFSDYSIVLSGGIYDKEITTLIHDEIPQVIDLSGKTNIQELIGLVELSKVVICNDSAILHICIAQNHPLIGLFGPTSMKSRVPESQLEYCIQSTESCSPCYRYGKFLGCKKKGLCMRGILPEMVLKKLKKMLKNEV